MQTEKDAEIVGWVGRIGAAGAEHLMAQFGMGRSWAYHRLNVLVPDGLLEQKTLLYRTPGLYVASEPAPAYRVGQYCVPSDEARYRAAGMTYDRHHLARP
jgi:hypothetical protein